MFSMALAWFLGHLAQESTEGVRRRECLPTIDLLKDVKKLGSKDLAELHTLLIE